MIGEISLIVAVIGVLGAFLGFRQVYRGRQRQFEMLYIERYWSILDRLSLDALRGNRPRVESDDDARAAWAYLRLCEDELELRAAGWISDSAYKMWAPGIRIQLRQPLFHDVWADAQAATADSADAQFMHLRTFMSNEAGTYDPCELGRWRRYLRGLAGATGV